MFKMSFIVEDKNLPKVLHAVSGLVLNMEAPQPVGNAVVKKGKVMQASAASSVMDLVAQGVHAHPKPIISITELKQLITKNGGSSGSYPYYVKQLRVRKHVKPKSRGEWQILKAKA